MIAVNHSSVRVIWCHRDPHTVHMIAGGPTVDVTDTMEQ